VARGSSPTYLSTEAHTVSCISWPQLEQRKTFIDVSASESLVRSKVICAPHAQLGSSIEFGCLGRSNIANSLGFVVLQYQRDTEWRTCPAVGCISSFQTRTRIVADTPKDLAIRIFFQRAARRAKIKHSKDGNQRDVAVNLLKNGFGSAFDAWLRE